MWAGLFSRKKHPACLRTRFVGEKSYFRRTGITLKGCMEPGGIFTEKQNMAFSFKKLLPHLLAVVIFAIASMVYFSPQLEGKVVQQGDIINFIAMAKEARDYQEKTGEVALWTNTMFGGMPTYQISAPQQNNLMRVVEKVSQLGFDRPIGYFIMGMLLFYILLIGLGVHVGVAIIGALAFGLSTNHMVLFEAGHTSKVRAIFTLAPVLLGIVWAYRGRYLWGGVAFAVGMGLNIYANHPQMTYFFGLFALIYVIWKAVEAFRVGEAMRIVKASAFLLAGLVLAIGASASKIWTTYEYAEDTMRGAPILESRSDAPASSSETDGLEWGYAMQWSNGWKDLGASLIPGFVGGSSSEPLGASSATLKDLRQKGARVGDSIPLPVYWGDLPFTSGPAYFGAIVFFLFILGLQLRRDALTMWSGVTVLLSFFLSLGSNLEWFNRLFFEYVPMYNKFRTPNSILSVTTLFLPLVGGLVLSDIVRHKFTQAELLKGLKWAGGVVAGFAVLIALIGPSLFSFESPGDQQLVQSGLSLDAMIEDRKSFMRMDAIRTALFVLATAMLVYFYEKKKLALGILLGAVGLLTVIDLWGVDLRYVNEDSFVSKRDYDRAYQPRPVDQQILQDTDPSYRVYDRTINSFNSASTSYFHKTIGGYHPAKLQRYQDLIDRHIAPGNMAVFNMLNTRYFIVPGGDGAPVVQRNKFALGNSWFVDSIVIVDNANEEIEALNGLKPGETAVVHKEFSDYVSRFDPEPQGDIRLSSYSPNVMVYDVNTSSDQLAVFSEIWYGPNKGWKSYIDGEEVPHIRVNYALRAIKVPAGRHKIEFKFEPRSYYAGEKISLASSLLLILLVLGLVVMTLMGKGKSWT
jgi:hypothetical protein